MNVNDFTQSLQGMNPTELVLGAGMVGAVLTLVVIGHIIWFFVSAIGYYKMFQKAGESGWKAFIPLYKDFICFRFAWKTNIFLPFLITTVLVYLLPDSESFVVSLVALACAIICLVLTIKLDLRVARSFGKTTGWGVLLFFFPFIVSLILGLGKAEYIGNTTT